jgi:capsular exopolysaccharide synthesis family protein
VIMVTSPHAGEGKTVTTANLGVALAQAGKRVILISADLRKPRLHHFFGLDNHTGLTNVLSGGVSPWQAVKNTRVENLQVMPSGPVPENPAEMLGSDAMGRLLSVPTDMADYVLVDAAPVLAVADAATLAPLTDAVLFVADAQRTHRGSVEQARRQLEQVNAHIIGAVLNNFDPSKAGAYSYYRYSYRYEDQDKAQQQTEEAEERTNVLRWRSGTKG